MFNCNVFIPFLGYLSSPCNIEGNVFVNEQTKSSEPAVELRLLNTIFGNSEETVSRLADVTNLEDKVLKKFSFYSVSNGLR